MKPRHFAVPDPLNPGALSFWFVRSALGADPIEPWPNAKAWGAVRRADVPPEILADRQALERWLNDLEASGLRAVEAAILADPAAAATRFAEHHRRCFYCGKPLTDERSMAYGVGPDCRRGMAVADLLDLFKLAKATRFAGGTP